jgi:hypothetical protein
VTCKINDLFEYCTNRRLKRADQELYKPLQLGESWDPLTVTQGLLAHKYDITVSDMNNENVEEYNNGIVVNRAAHGNTAEKKRQMSDQEFGKTTKAAKRQKTTEEMEQDVKQIVCNCAKNHISTINGNTSEILLLCNDLTKNFMCKIKKNLLDHYNVISVHDTRN